MKQPTKKQSVKPVRKSRDLTDYMKPLSFVLSHDVLMEKNGFVTLARLFNGVTVLSLPATVTATWTVELVMDSSISAPDYDAAEIEFELRFLEPDGQTTVLQKIKLATVQHGHPRVLHRLINQLLPGLSFKTTGLHKLQFYGCTKKTDWELMTEYPIKVTIVEAPHAAPVKEVAARAQKTSK